VLDQGMPPIQLLRESILIEKEIWDDIL